MNRIVIRYAAASTARMCRSAMNDKKRYSEPNSCLKRLSRHGHDASTSPARTSGPTQPSPAGVLGRRAAGRAANRCTQTRGGARQTVRVAAPGLRPLPAPRAPRRREAIGELPASSRLDRSASTCAHKGWRGGASVRAVTARVSARGALTGSHVRTGMRVPDRR